MKIEKPDIFQDRFCNDCNSQENVKLLHIGQMVIALCKDCRETLINNLEADKGEENNIKWEKAKKYLEEMIAIYQWIGPNGYIALTRFLYPMRMQLENGVRTEELYEEIMNIE